MIRTEGRQNSSPTRSGPTAPTGHWVTVTTAGLLVVSIVAAAVTLWLPGLLYGPAAMIGSARGTALIVLAAAVPTLILAGIAARKGHGAALGVWLGAVGYLAYNAGLFVYATPYNRAFLLYVAMLGLSVWTLGGLLAGVGRQACRLSPQAARTVAGYLTLVVVMTAGAWLRAIVPTIAADQPGAVIDGLGVATNPVYIQDLAFGLPAAMVTAVLVWRRRPGSGGLAIAMLVYFLLESISIAVDQWFAVTADPTTAVASAAAVPVFAILAVLDLAVLAVAVRHLQPPTEPT
jgi:hypothetical protein